MDPLKALSPTVRKVVYPLVTLGAFVTAVLVAAAWAEGKVDTRAAAAVAPVTGELMRHGEQLRDHEQRLRSVEEMKGDVKFIRRALEHWREE